MESGLLKVLTNGCTMHACMGGMMPMDVVRFLAICREVHGLVSAEDILVAKFAVSRWYCAGGSLSTWRTVWQQCVEAAALRGWNASVWAHAEMMIEADESTEFDGWSEPLGKCEYYDLWVPQKDDRALVAYGLEEHLAFITELDLEVLAILAIFMMCPPGRLTSYWSFMLLLADGSFAGVHIDDYCETLGIRCEFSATPNALNNWSIDDGGRVLMSMDIGDQFPDHFPPDVDWSELLALILTEAMMSRGIHTRQARDGVAYTWNEFLEWYGCEHWREHFCIGEYGLCQPALARWRAARPIQ